MNREPTRSPDDLAVEVFRRLVLARDVREILAAQRELRRLGWSVCRLTTKHRPPEQEPAKFNLRP